MQSKVGGGSTPLPICASSSLWIWVSETVHVVVPAQCDGVRVTAPKKVPGRMSCSLPPVTPTVLYSWSQPQYELWVTSV